MATESISYETDSAAKKIARAVHWVTALRYYNAEKFRNGVHLVLAGRDGGDVPALMMLGVRPKNIVAVDKDKEAVFELLEKYEGIRTVNDDVFTVANEYKHKLMSAHFDFSAKASRDHVDRAITVMSAMPNFALWGYTFSYEEGEETADVEGMKEHIVSTMERMARNRTSSKAGPTFDAIVEELIASKDPAVRRSHIIEEYIHWTMSFRVPHPPAVAVPTYSISYIGTAADGRKKAMCSIGGPVLRKTNLETVRSFTERLNASRDLYKVLQVPDNVEELDAFAEKMYEIFRHYDFKVSQIAMLLNVTTAQLEAILSGGAR